jgi:hypothetical protein
MKFNGQNSSCHPERSEGSVSMMQGSSIGWISLVCHPERSEGSVSMALRSFAALRMT